jgi:hypothetical protein
MAADGCERSLVLLIVSDFPWPADVAAPRHRFDQECPDDASGNQRITIAAGRFDRPE